MAVEEMQLGYPAESDIDDELAGLGIELIVEYNNNFVLDYKQYTWGMLNALRWAMSLGVYCPSPTTINVRGGKYLFRGTVKTYTTGSAINPTDNDTTYVWMKDDNTIGTDIDGNGWPSTEHIKLAEVDVDSDGYITAIRDLRGQTFLEYISDEISSKKLIDVIRLNFNAPTELTISSGAVTGTQAVHTIDTEGEAASDDLDTITATNYASGEIVIIVPENAARVVTVKDGTGNINLRTGDYKMDNADDCLVLRYDGSNFVEMTRSGKSKVTKKMQLPSSVGGGTADIAAVTGAAAIRFDTDAEYALAGFQVPADWDAVSDMTIKAKVQNGIAEDDGDDIKFDMTVHGIADGETNSDAGQNVDLDLNLTGGDEAINKVNLVSGAIDYDHGTYPIAAGDSVILKATVNLGDTGECTGPLYIVDWWVEYTALI